MLYLQKKISILKPLSNFDFAGGALPNHCSCYTRPVQKIVLRLTEVQSDELHHVRLKQIHVPPRHTFRSCQSARVHIEEGTSAAVDSFLRNATQIRADLHRSLSCCHVQNCKIIQSYKALRHHIMQHHISSG
jgi:ribosomal protein S13